MTSTTTWAERVFCRLLLSSLVLFMSVQKANSQSNYKGGPGGPILVITGAANPFTNYYAEILRTEGLNSFAVADISTVSAGTLSAYDLALLGDMPLTAGQVTMFTTWVNGGGKLIAMHPDNQLASLLGLTVLGQTLSNGYLLIDVTKSPGSGLVNQSIQYHGPANLYLPGTANKVATIFSNASTATSNPAVTLRSVGGNGGQAAAFAYDLARSVVYTRQGNPAWVGQSRGGLTPIRTFDLFYGNAGFDPQPDWVDLNNIAIPQADEQQRLLANLILQMTLGNKPLPRFWYYPFGKKAVVVMTGDDHANGGTAGRYDDFIASSPAGCVVANWECIRSTSYIYPGTPITDSQVAAYNSQGFETALHVLTNCADYTQASLETFMSTQLNQFLSQYPSAGSPITNRTHCIPWSDWITHAQVEFNHGIRLDTNYYYYPPNWVVLTPGFFTGSGNPMRFADTDGTMLDVYQATSQMTDESGQAFPDTVAGLLDNATGQNGFFGAFVANMHTDRNGTYSQADADFIVASAKTHNVPVVSSRQMLRWLDGRNSSYFTSLTWAGNSLSFSSVMGANTNGLQVLLPASTATGGLASITLGGSPV
ncbi:MAG: hypothetical protein JWO80_5850, partial [Bryobacterales bacterium]|nr:hypothetical protein [Bryobacterales bacterium]